MSAILQSQRKYSLEEYYELEKNSEEKFEFWNGNVGSMAGARPEHEVIVGNTITALNIALRGRNCRVFPSNLRVKVPAYPPYRYPDLTALCGQAFYEEFGGVQALVNPTLIVEVLSKSTQAFDLADKFTYYKSIASFTNYLLISADRPHVMLYTKRDEKVWLHQEFGALEEKVHLPSLECEVALAEIYYNIEFPPPEPEPLPLDGREPEENR